MLFSTEVLFRTSAICKPGVRSHEIVEAFNVEVEANSFEDAQEKVFAELKTATSVGKFMSENCAKHRKEDDK